MMSLALVLKGIPLDHITFVQYPGTTGIGGIYAGKVAPLKDIAAKLFAKIKADIPFTLDSGTGTGRGSVADPNAPTTGSSTASPSPAATGDATGSSSAPIVGVLGQTAADYTCSKVNR